MGTDAPIRAGVVASNPVSCARRGKGLLAVLLAASMACTGEPSEAPPRHPPSKGSVVVGEPMRLLDISPADGAWVDPRVIVRLRFDRSVDPGSLGRGRIRMEYVVVPERLLEDPFRHLAVWVDRDDDHVVAVQPPDLILGTSIRLIVGQDVRGADGSPLAAEQGAPPGTCALRTYRVLELPP